MKSIACVAVVMMVVVVTGLISITSAKEVSCNAGFTLLNGDTCIKVVLLKLTWEQARDTCSSIDIFSSGIPQLARIDDCAHMSSLWSFVRHKLGVDHDLWIGGSDSTAENNWVWLDGSPVPMGPPFWHPEQPDGDTRENKLVFAYNGYLADGHEDELRGFICQYTP